MSDVKREICCSSTARKPQFNCLLADDSQIALPYEMTGNGTPITSPTQGRGQLVGQLSKHR